MTAMTLRPHLAAALLLAAAAVAGCDRVLDTEPYDRVAAERAVTDMATA